MFLRGVLFTLMLLLTSLTLNINTQAQIPTAAVSITCDGKMEIDVQTGNSLSDNISCEIENPTAYIEKIEITVNSGDFAHSAPGSIYIAPGSSETIDITIQADQGTSAQTQTVAVHVRVTELSGLPPANNAESEAKFVLSILQYSGCSIGNQNSFTEIELNNELTLSFEIYNLGNGEDIMDIELSDSSKNLLQQIGFIHSLPLGSIAIEEQTEPVSIVLNLKAPSEFSSDDLVEENRISGIEIEVKVTSRNSCESDSGCETDTAFVMLDLIGNSEESEGSFVTLSGESGNQFLVFGGGFVAGGILLSLIFMFIKKP